MKKALFVSPYLDHLGGGERYVLSAASALESFGYQIYFSWDNTEEINHLAQMLGIQLKQPLLDPAVKQLYFSRNPMKMYLATKKYDLVLYLSDGSLPLLGGKKNLVHLQVPFHGVGGKSWQNQIKKRCLTHVIVNSQFTKNIVDREYSINSEVLYPPVKPIKSTLAKDNIILSVGRFEPSLNAKKQDVLIEAWRALSPQLPGWKLVLAGGSSNEEWIANLKKLASGFPIEFATNISHADLAALYSRAKLYWHAAGYKIDELKNPELTEHFGISTVEAISAFAVPLVVPRGGQIEIVKNPSLHWQTKEELINKTQKILAENSLESYLADLKIDDYLEESFAKHLQKLIS